jgi:hypothetical protein
MLLTLTVLLVSQPAAPAPAEDPIVITSNRLDAVRFNLSVNRLTGGMKCTVARSSGDAAIDSYMCEVARYCAQTSRNTRTAIEQCIAERKKAYLARYAAERGS